MLKYIFTSLLVTATFFSYAQEVEDEVGFMYMKAEYLLETQRYSEAIKQYGEVIRIQADYKEALIQRAKAKYAMASFRGVKEDVMNYIKSKGASADALTLLAKVDYRQGNHEAALNSLNTLMACGSNDAEAYFIKGECHLALEQFQDACGNWSQAASMGYNKASLQVNKYCKDIVGTKPNSGPRPRPNKGGDSTTSSTPTQSTPVPGKPTGSPKPTKPGKPSGSGMGGSTRDTQDDEVIVLEKPEPKMPVDNSVNEIEVDDDLTLIIRNGLGGRKLIQQPNILILADEGGTVAIDVVVNERGRVDSAEVNATASSLNTQSIISLATRKAKEFWFEKSEYDAMEGTILFVISGR